MKGFPAPFLSDERYEKERKHHRKGVAEDHRKGADGYNPVGGVDIVHIRQEEKQHVQHFRNAAYGQAVEPGSLLVVKHEFPAERTENAG